ncbi:MAG TPA: threonine synthase [Bacteroidales bacterium]|nr:threonine synthase [Bacteroidales bacterium]
MKFVSSRSNTSLFSLKDTLFQGLAPDGGLFMPQKYPDQSLRRLRNMETKTFTDLALELAKPYLDEDIDDDGISKIVNEAFDFDIPFKHLKNDIYALELFRGPTLAFKDVGARFMARLINQINREKEDITILVATSGDTGGAVASGFNLMDNIKVVVLYPEGRVSKFQELQFTGLGNNINCLAVDGSFDDCQRMVKEAFSDIDLRKTLKMTSANSINIGRWLPQSFYYTWGMLKWLEENPDVFPVVSVPSGNYGNLTAGMLAYECGMPFNGFIAASNINNTVPVYIRSGIYQPQESVKTITNAMDVGNPSNFERMKYIGGSWKNISEMVSAFEFKDHEILKGIERVYHETGYILDPHSATGYLAMEKSKCKGFFIATAHPVKFLDVMPENIRDKVKVPSYHSQPGNEGLSIKISKDYSDLRNYLLKS